MEGELNTKKLITLRNKKNFITEISKYFYDETRDETCITCDLIIKTGPEKFEHFCHQIIFASASEFLSTCLTNTRNGSFPIILLPDVKTSTFGLILKYIYNGEVKVPVGNYADFVEALELLQLTGLSNNDEVLEEMNDEMTGSEIVTQQTESIDLSEANESTSSESTIFTGPQLRITSVSTLNKSYCNEKPDTDDEFPEDNTDDLFDCETDSDTYEPPTPKQRRSVSKSLKMTPSNGRLDWSNITEENQNLHEKIFHEFLRKFYMRRGIEVNAKGEENIRNSTFFIEDKKLKRVIHCCIRCDSQITLTHQIKKGWRSDNLIQHLKTSECSDDMKQQGITNWKLLTSEENKIIFKSKLGKRLKLVYKECDIKIDNNFEDSLKNTKLIYKDGKLQKSSHKCSLCGSFVVLGSRGRYLNIWNMKRHIESCRLNKKKD